MFFSFAGVGRITRPLVLTAVTALCLSAPSPAESPVDSEAPFFPIPGGLFWELEPVVSEPGFGDAGPANLPIDLILDDDSAEGNFGIGSGVTANQFLWFNQFDLAGLGPIRLGEIQVLFQPGDNMAVGNEIQLVVYHDPDGNPGNGADLVATFDETILELDGLTFSAYPLDPLVALPQGGFAYLGVVSRFVESGVTSPTNPAALDTDSSAELSWVAVWDDDPPTEPELPPDLFLDRVSVFTPGNWMIRGFAQGQAPVEVPTLGPMGLLLLSLLLAGVALRRRRLLS